MRTHRGLVATAITALTVPIVVAGPASASTTHVVHPGQSVQAAINRAEPGDTIASGPAPTARTWRSPRTGSRCWATAPR